MILSCRKCGNTGHNARTCKGQGGPSGRGNGGVGRGRRSGGAAQGGMGISSGSGGGGNCGVATGSSRQKMKVKCAHFYCVLLYIFTPLYAYYYTIYVGEKYHNKQLKVDYKHKVVKQPQMFGEMFKLLYLPCI